MMPRLAAALLLCVAGFGTGCSNAPSEDQCKQLLGHFVDLEYKKGGVPDNEAAKAEVQKQKAAVSEKLSADFVDTCKKKIAKSRVECSLSASTLDAVAKCDDQK